MKIRYIERSTGEERFETVYYPSLAKISYGDGFCNRLISKVLLFLFVKFPLLSILGGFWQKSRASKRKIAPFIQKFGVDRSEFLKEDFSSFNDFFIRKLKPEARPIDRDPKVLITPADGRYLTYSQFTEFAIKGKTFSLLEFTQNQEYASRYADGSMAIIRLCPSDYHHFHFPYDGLPSKPRLINGFFDSVSPLALQRKIRILCENKRMITEFETDRFGTILIVEIGAIGVGAIRQTFTPESFVKKGAEKGYFEFGGSCIVLLFEKNRVEFDPIFLQSTKKGLETRSNFGQSLAKIQM